jgi:hypothetical protein
MAVVVAECLVAATTRLVELAEEAKAEALELLLLLQDLLTLAVAVAVFTTKELNLVDQGS